MSAPTCSFHTARCIISATLLQSAFPLIVLRLCSCATLAVESQLKRYFEATNCENSEISCMKAISTNGTNTRKSSSLYRACYSTSYETSSRSSAQPSKKWAFTTLSSPRSPAMPRYILLQNMNQDLDATRNMCCACLSSMMTGEQAPCYSLLPLMHEVAPIRLFS